MGGVNVDSGGGGGRRNLDSEINMIPMIDLLMVTISFLLITAVWSHMARINADAQVPGPPRPEEEQVKKDPEKQLHIDMKTPDKFTLQWKAGATMDHQLDVPRKDTVVAQGGARVVRYPELAATIAQEWKTYGSHRDVTDKVRDVAILHTDNETQYTYIVGVIDAIYAASRPVNYGSKTENIPAFNVTFSVN